MGCESHRFLNLSHIAIKPPYSVISAFRDCASSGFFYLTVKTADFIICTSGGGKKQSLCVLPRSSPLHFAFWIEVLNKMQKRQWKAMCMKWDIKRKSCRVAAQMERGVHCPFRFGGMSAILCRLVFLWGTKVCLRKQPSMWQGGFYSAFVGVFGYLLSRYSEMPFLTLSVFFLLLILVHML